MGVRHAGRRPARAQRAECERDSLAPGDREPLVGGYAAGHSRPLARNTGGIPHPRRRGATCTSLDVLDIGEACANQFACTGGFSAAQLVDHVSMIATHFRIGAAAITAYDPACDPEGRIPPIVRDIVETIASVTT